MLGGSSGVINIHTSILIFLFQVIQEGLIWGLVLEPMQGCAFPEGLRSFLGLGLVLVSSVLGMEAYLGMAFVYGVSADVVHLVMNVVFALSAFYGTMIFCLMSRGGLRRLWEVGMTERIATVIKITLIT
jgi:hypothetical protein